MLIAKFYRFRIAKFCPKQEIIDVITQSKEAYEFWIIIRISSHRVNIALWKRTTNYFEIEITNFMIDTSYKFVINNPDMKIQICLVCDYRYYLTVTVCCRICLWQCHQNTVNLLYGHHPTWWRHQMEAFSALLGLCAGNSPVPVKSPHKGQWRGALMFFF